MALRKVVSMILGVTLLSSFIMVGCAKNDAGSSGTPTSQTSTAKAEKTADAVKALDEISIFYGTARLNINPCKWQ